MNAPASQYPDAGEFAQYVRAVDWGATPLGPMQHWPASLRITVDTLLASPVAMALVWGADRNMIYNQAYARIAGARHPAAMGQPVRTVWPEAWDNWNRDIFERGYAGEAIAARNQPLGLARDGALRPYWFDLYYTPIVEGAAVGGVLCVAVDCTERHHSEMALRESEEQFRTLAEAVPHHVWMADATGNFSWFNSRIYDFVGVPPGADLNGEWAPLVHPDDLDAMLAAWTAALAVQSPFEHSYRMRGHDGAYRWHLARALPTRDDAGRFVRWIGTNTDIHDQRADTGDLIERNATLEQRVALRTRERDRIWNVSRDLLLVADGDGRWLAVNPAWHRTLGWNEADLLGGRSAALVHPEDQEATAAELRKLRAGQSSERFENRIRAQDDRYRTISWTAVPDDGMIYCVARDITDEREAAQMLAETEAALHQAQKMEVVGQLTGGIAHDFNNLLQGITGSLDIVRRRLSNGQHEDVARFLDGAADSAHRAATLTHRLLAFARRQPLDPRPTRANQLIESMEDLLGRTLGERVTLRCDLAADLWSTHCDTNQLESAVLNLAINGRDAMPDGGTLAIATANVTDSRHLPAGLPPGDYIRIAVSDIGSGMPPEVASRAFEPFFTTKPNGRGTGLGLSMIYGFTRQSRGKAVIESVEGAGTTIALYLPRWLGGEGDMPATDGRTETPVGHGETILVIEDETVVRLMIVELLNELSYKVIEAADAEPGLAILRSGAHVDLLVTDIGLPGMNGQDFAEEARRLHPDLPILYMTGYSEAATRPEGFLGPGMALITKPFGGDAFARRIHSMLLGG
ncbi:PAS domain-containing hybrid sensor histidine kinase/response regulator [Sphingomonas sp. KC8]|uniref:PAS domain-containing hybrid sensor histidine kinase/response regulator n=1 Tax=Sphingomonas sp. KC8 TaxID=1030157 RepID=UPI0002D6A79E|nr:PAS domain-containing sensor histidine kinase [Sphingomonas sp. KC8]ARS26197.1 PAS/PAC sensor hybrid histidine kinase [Sphingomonas sp. KC8]